MGFLPFVLFNFFLDDFDRQISSRLPSSCWYGRFLSDCIIAPPKGSTIDDIKQMIFILEGLLQNLSLEAKLIFLVPGGTPIPIRCMEMLLSVDEEGRIHSVERSP